MLIYCSYLYIWYLDLAKYFGKKSWESLLTVIILLCICLLCIVNILPLTFWRLTKWIGWVDCVNSTVDCVSCAVLIAPFCIGHLEHCIPERIWAQQPFFSPPPPPPHIRLQILECWISCACGVLISTWWTAGGDKVVVGTVMRCPLHPCSHPPTPHPPPQKKKKKESIYICIYRHTKILKTT